jgi:hypothetical protein
MPSWTAPPSDSELGRRLAEQSPTLSKALSDIHDRANDGWLHLLGQDKGSYTGHIHLRNVERTAMRLLPEKLKQTLTDVETFVLLASVFLHDIGKIVPGRKALPAGRRCLRREWNHHCAGKEYLDNHWAELGLPSARLAGYCGLLAYSHCLDRPLDQQRTCICDSACPLGAPKREAFRDTSVDPFGSLRIPLLAAVLRVADEAENSWTRALTGHAYELYLRAGKDLGKAFRRHVEDVEFCHQGNCIILRIPDEFGDDPNHEASVLANLAMTGASIERVLHAWKGELEKAGVRLLRVFFEHGGRLYKDAATGFKGRTDPKQLLGAEAAVFERFENFQSAVCRLLRGSLGWEHCSWDSIEELMRERLDQQDRWLFQKILGGIEGVSIAPSDRKGCDLSITISGQSQFHANTVFRADEERETESDLKKKLSDFIRRYWRGTSGYQTLRWSSLEAAVGHRLGPRERWLVRTLEVPGFRLLRGQNDRELILQLEAELLRKRAKAEEVVACIVKLWRGSLGYCRFSWLEVEAALGETIDWQIRHEVVSRSPFEVKDKHVAIRDDPRNRGICVGTT